MGTPIEDALQRAILGPLGMSGTTVDSAEAGLPTARTTVPDLVRFWTAWFEGGLRGNGPAVLAAWSPSPHGGPADVAWEFYRGVWLDRVAGSPRLTLMCGAEPTSDPGVRSVRGFQVLPESGSVLALGSVGVMPVTTTMFILDRLGEDLGAGTDIYGPVELMSFVSVPRTNDRCRALSLGIPRTLESVGPPSDPAAWAGRYRNGNQYFELEVRDGGLVSAATATRPFVVHELVGDRRLALYDREPIRGLPLELFTDGQGRRHLLLGDLAYRHADDAPPR